MRRKQQIEEEVEPNDNSETETQDEESTYSDMTLQGATIHTTPKHSEKLVTETIVANAERLQQEDRIREQTKHNPETEIDKGYRTRAEEMRRRKTSSGLQDAEDPSTNRHDDPSVCHLREGDAVSLLQMTDARVPKEGGEGDGGRAKEVEVTPTSSRGRKVLVLNDREDEWTSEVEMKEDKSWEGKLTKQEKDLRNDGWIIEEEMNSENIETCDRIVEELPWRETGIKKRCYICALTFMNYAFYLLLRSNIIVGMQAMVNSTALHQLQRDEGGPNVTESSRSFLPQAESDGNYIWNQDIQNAIVISFYWGYALTGIPGGIIAETYGSKHVLAFGLLISGICMTLVPFAAEIDWTFVVVIRLIMGFSQGPSNPATHSIIALWCPVEETTRYTTIAFSGTTTGTMMTDFITGFIIRFIGWKANSYILGSVTILWVLVWYRYFAETPEDYKGISENELQYLLQERRYTKPKLKTPSTPWKHILLSVPLWATVGSQAFFQWYSYTYDNHFPKYISNIIELGDTIGGMVFSICSSFIFITNCTIGVRSDTRIKNGVVTRTAQRKQTTLFFQWGSALFLIVLCYCQPIGGFIPIFILLSLCSGGTTGGYLVNYIDLAPNYAGTLVGIGNTVTTFFTLAAHQVTMKLLYEHSDRIDDLEAWRTVIWICAVFTLVGGLVYVIFGTGKQQKWNDPDNMRLQRIFSNSSSIYSVNC